MAQSLDEPGYVSNLKTGERKIRIRGAMQKSGPWLFALQEARGLHYPASEMGRKIRCFGAGAVIISVTVDGLFAAGYYTHG